MCAQNKRRGRQAKKERQLRAYQRLKSKEIINRRMDEEIKVLKERLGEMAWQ